MNEISTRKGKPNQRPYKFANILIESRMFPMLTFAWIESITVSIPGFNWSQRSHRLLLVFYWIQMLFMKMLVLYDQLFGFRLNAKNVSKHRREDIQDHFQILSQPYQNIKSFKLLQFRFLYHFPQYFPKLNRI